MSDTIGPGNFPTEEIPVTDAAKKPLRPEPVEWIERQVRRIGKIAAVSILCLISRDGAPQAGIFNGGPHSNIAALGTVDTNNKNIKKNGLEVIETQTEKVLDIIRRVKSTLNSVYPVRHENPFLDLRHPEGTSLENIDVAIELLEKAKKRIRERQDFWKEEEKHAQEAIGILREKKNRTDEEEERLRSHNVTLTLLKFDAGPLESIWADVLVALERLQEKKRESEKK